MGNASSLSGLGSCVMIHDNTFLFSTGEEYSSWWYPEEKHTHTRTQTTNHTQTLKQTRATKGKESKQGEKKAHGKEEEQVSVPSMIRERERERKGGRERERERVNGGGYRWSRGIPVP